MILVMVLQYLQVNPSHVYTSPGKYTITLNAVTPVVLGKLIQEQSV
jgi:PKD repeat protein